MPNPWEKAKKLGGISRLLVSNLRSKAKRGGESSLVVQVGFPTSLADLVVKNHSRLRKPSRRKHMQPHPSPGVGGGHDGGSSMASRVSEIIAAVRSPEDGGGSPPGPVVGEVKPNIPEASPGGDDISEEIRCPPVSAASEPQKNGASQASAGGDAQKSEVIEARTGAAVLRREIFRASTRVATGKSEDLVASAGAEARKSEAGRSGGLISMAKVAFLMVILAIGSKKLAMWISVSAFALLFLESMGKRLCTFFRPCPNAKKSLDAMVGSVSDLLQPPDPSGLRDGRGALRESPETRGSGLIRTEMRWEVVALVGIEQKVDRVIAEKGPIEIGGGSGNWKAGAANSKARKLFGKFIPKKFHKARGGKHGKDPDLDTSSRGASGREGEGEEIVGDGGSDDAENGDDEAEILGFKTPAKVLDAVPDGAVSIGGIAGRTARGSPRHLAFFAIILSGLIGGRIAALTLTVAWCLTARSMRSLWRNQRRIGRSGLIL